MGHLSLCTQVLLLPLGVPPTMAATGFTQTLTVRRQDRNTRWHIGTKLLAAAKDVPILRSVLAPCSRLRVRRTLHKTLDVQQQKTPKASSRTPLHPAATNVGHSLSIVADNGSQPTI
mmetsp:Transcript_23636/g.37634  ORF Transcript_23636/g.37634 Transcript_23636/m.37634 type:complete len:117 (-) Transcript_23636:147-497(-)